ncbi:MAG: hypothetical protein M5R36_05955 [Deltaproteobacteria bacterium]|nr:hypothetical protein [Deltaproteobacteria bacterium]
MPKRFPGLWLCALTAVFALSFVWGCGDDDDDSGGAADDDETAIDDDAGFSDDDASGPDDDDGWQPVAPHREDRGAWHVVWLAGNAYEMGYQHGELMHDEIAEGMAWLDDMNVIDVVIPVAKALGFGISRSKHRFPNTSRNATA